MEVEPGIVFPPSGKGGESNHGGKFGFLHRGVVFVAVENHVVSRLVSVLPEDVFGLPLRKSVVSVVDDETQVPGNESGNFGSEILDFHVYSFQSPDNKLVDKYGYGTFHVLVVVFPDPVVVPSDSTECYHFSLFD